MTTPEEARDRAAFVECHDPRITATMLRDLANQVERLEGQRKELREALQWIVTDFGSTSSEDVTSLANARAALKATR